MKQSGMRIGWLVLFFGLLCQAASAQPRDINGNPGVRFADTPWTGGLDEYGEVSSTGFNLCNEMFVTEHHVFDLDIDGDIAYAAMGIEGIQIFDVSGAEQPELIGEFQLVHGINKVLVFDSVLYGLAFETLICLDVSDPENPVLIGSIDLDDYLTSISYSNGIVFLGQSRSGTSDGRLLVVDVNNPMNPALIGSADTTGRSSQKKLVGSYVYIALGSGGWGVFDVSDLESPFLTASFPRRIGFTTAIEILDQKAFVGESNFLVTYDISDPSAPVELGAVEVQGGVGFTDFEYLPGALWATNAGSPELISFGSLSSNPNSYSISRQEMPGFLTKILLGNDRVSLGMTGYRYADVPPDQWNGAPGLMTVTDFGCPPCVADLTLDGLLDFFDVSVFLQSFSYTLPEGDFNGDGLFDFFDVSAFLTAFGAGCP